MAMARTEYSNKVSGDGIVRGKANELPISPKHAIEIASFLKGKRVAEAITYLEDVTAGKRAIPFRRFRRDISHQRCLTGYVNGCYPRKASEAYLRLLRSIQKNAEYAGVDPESIEVIHASANRGRGMDAFFPRAMGRATPKRRETTNLEIITREVE